MELSKTGPNKQGYLRVKLDGRMELQHQIFAIARWGKECIGMTVNHINENKQDNSWDNLELVTMVDNIKLRTSDHGFPKMPIKAINIETGYGELFESQLEASKILGLKAADINNMINGRQKRVGKYKFEKII
jgi:hypothetical protein